MDQLRDITLDDEDLMREVVASLIDDTARQMHLLEAAIQEENAGTCMRLAHYSKGACANLGATGAAEALRKIEQQAAHADFPQCREALLRLGEELELLRFAAQNL